MLNSIKYFGQNFWSAIQLFINHQLISQAAALAYYAIFSLPPLLLIVLTSTKQLYFWGTSENYIFDEIQGLIGKEATTLLQQSMQEIASFHNSGFGLVFSIGLILFSSTSVFMVIQTGFNKIFGVQASPGVWRNVLMYLLSRLISLGILIGFAFLLVVSLTFQMAITALSDYLFGSTLSSTITDIMGSMILPLMLLTLFFGIMFKVLPDVSISFRDVWPGAIFTAILFVLGKYLIGYYIGNSTFNNTYASASSLIVVLVWSYYSSILVLFGCAYLKSRIDRRGGKIVPSSYAQFTDQSESSD